MKNYFIVLAASLLISSQVLADDAARPVGNPNDVLRAVRANPDQSIDIMENTHAEQLAADQINENATAMINAPRSYKPAHTPHKKAVSKIKMSKKKARPIVYKATTMTQVSTKHIHKHSTKRPSTLTKRRVKKTKHIT